MVVEGRPAQTKGSSEALSAYPRSFIACFDLLPASKRHSSLLKPTRPRASSRPVLSHRLTASCAPAAAAAAAQQRQQHSSGSHGNARSRRGPMAVQVQVQYRWAAREDTSRGQAHKGGSSRQSAGVHSWNRLGEEVGGGAPQLQGRRQRNGRTASALRTLWRHNQANGTSVGSTGTSKQQRLL